MRRKCWWQQISCQECKKDHKEEEGCLTGMVKKRRGNWGMGMTHCDRSGERRSEDKRNESHLTSPSSSSHFIPISSHPHLIPIPILISSNLVNDATRKNENGRLYEESRQAVWLSFKARIRCSGILALTLIIHDPMIRDATDAMTMILLDKPLCLNHNSFNNGLISENEYVHS